MALGEDDKKKIAEDVGALEEKNAMDPAALKDMIIALPSAAALTDDEKKKLDEDVQKWIDALAVDDDKKVDGVKAMKLVALLKGCDKNKPRLVKI